MKTFKSNFTPCLASFLALTLFWGPVFPLMAKSHEPEHLSADYPPLVIGPGDMLSITVVGYHHSGTPSNLAFSNNSADLPTEYLVESNGCILFPFVGSVKLVGMSQAEAGTMIMKKLSKYLRYPQVTVLIQSTNSYNVSVLGQVFKPGKYPIRGQATFLSAISEAGGPIENADLGGTILVHKGKKMKLDLGQYLEGNKTNKEDPYVYPGDIIMIPKSGWPSTAEWAIIASIISSGVIVFSTLHH